MGLATLILSVALALDGESSNAKNTALAVISVVSIVFGYLLLAALWYFVFRGKAREKRQREALRTSRGASAAEREGAEHSRRGRALGGCVAHYEAQHQRDLRSMRQTRAGALGKLDVERRATGPGGHEDRFGDHDLRRGAGGEPDGRGAADAELASR